MDDVEELEASLFYFIVRYQDEIFDCAARQLHNDRIGHLRSQNHHVGLVVDDLALAPYALLVDELTAADRVPGSCANRSLKGQRASVNNHATGHHHYLVKHAGVSEQFKFTLAIYTNKPTQEGDSGHSVGVKGQVTIVNTVVT